MGTLTSVSQCVASPCFYMQAYVQAVKIQWQFQKIYENYLQFVINVHYFYHQLTVPLYSYMLTNIFTFMWNVQITKAKNALSGKFYFCNFAKPITNSQLSEYKIESCIFSCFLVKTILSLRHNCQSCCDKKERKKDQPVMFIPYFLDLMQTFCSYLVVLSVNFK